MDWSYCLQLSQMNSISDYYCIVVPRTLASCAPATSAVHAHSIWSSITAVTNYKANHQTWLTTSSVLYYSATLKSSYSNWDWPSCFSYVYADSSPRACDPASAYEWSWREQYYAPVGLRAHADLCYIELWTASCRRWLRHRESRSWFDSHLVFRQFLGTHPHHLFCELFAGLLSCHFRRLFRLFHLLYLF